MLCVKNKLNEEENLKQQKQHQPEKKREQQQRTQKKHYHLVNLLDKLANCKLNFTIFLLMMMLN